MLARHPHRRTARLSMPKRQGASPRKSAQSFPRSWPPLILPCGGCRRRTASLPARSSAARAAPAPALHGPVQPERCRLFGVRVHLRLLSCGACGAALRSVHLRRRSCPSQGRFRGLFDRCCRGRRSVGPLACGMLAAICRRESSVLAKASAEPCNAAGFCLGFPDRPRCKAAFGASR